MTTIDYSTITAIKELIQTPIIIFNMLIKQKIISILNSKTYTHNTVKKLQQP